MRGKLTFIVQPFESLCYSLWVLRVHRESGSTPVQRSTHHFKLYGRQVWSINTFSISLFQGDTFGRVKTKHKKVFNEQTWSNILPPFSLFHFHTLRRNSSLPMENLSKEGSRDLSCFSTTTWVAIPAWSHPGTQRVRKPRILRQRTNVSWVNKKTL